MVTSLAFAGTLLVGCATPQLGPLDETWFACSHDRQCRIIEDPICALVPINKRYAKPFAEHVRVAHPLELATGPCPSQAVRYRALCGAGRCTSKARGLIRHPRP